MRFITEFELDFNAHDKIIEACKGRYCLEMGNMVSESFGWKEKAKSTKDHYSLEIEAFPMDKWIDFKNELFEYVFNSGGTVSGTTILEMIKKLESFKNPEIKSLQ